MKEKFVRFIKENQVPALILTSLVFIAFVLVITALSLTPTARIEVLVAPASATVTINGKTYKNGTYDLPKGNLTVKIEKNGFTTKEYAFNSESSSKLYDYLTAEDGSLNWYLEHQDDALILTAVGDYVAEILSARSSANYPILEKLPIIVSEYDAEDKFMEFRIDGGEFEGCEREFCLKVTDSTGGNLELARQKIREVGFNPSDFQILYEYTPIIPLE